MHSKVVEHLEKGDEQVAALLGVATGPRAMPPSTILVSRDRYCNGERIISTNRLQFATEKAELQNSTLFIDTRQPNSVL